MLSQQGRKPNCWLHLGLGCLCTIFSGCATTSEKLQGNWECNSSLTDYRENTLDLKATGNDRFEWSSHDLKNKTKNSGAARYESRTNNLIFKEINGNNTWGMHVESMEQLTMDDERTRCFKIGGDYNLIFETYTRVELSTPS
ncbi:MULTISPECIES: hypothetical protein [Deinococcus]|uniref:Lipocalin-like domain-containing protein n=1 Tax=Deinococcus rufus TaxID=2136097 RepID=A0ABV7Z5V4_9DEIO|nr:hypothetical protein [Deinococcus sp. AB2017081]WQE95372.1 hypothetical protein U2P90_00410 [Deinococcus sp. AB2017081]